MCVRVCVRVRHVAEENAPPPTVTGRRSALPRTPTCGSDRRQTPGRRCAIVTKDRVCDGSRCPGACHDQDREATRVLARGVRVPSPPKTRGARRSATTLASTATTTTAAAAATDVETRDDPVLGAPAAIASAVAAAVGGTIIRNRVSARGIARVCQGRGVRATVRVVCRHKPTVARVDRPAADAGVWRKR